MWIVAKGWARFCQAVRNRYDLSQARGDDRREHLVKGRGRVDSHTTNHRWADEPHSACNICLTVVEGKVRDARSCGKTLRDGRFEEKDCVRSFATWMRSEAGTNCLRHPSCEAFVGGEI